MPYDMENLKDPYYKHFLNLLEEYWTETKYMNAEALLFPMEEYEARRKISKIGIFPHYFRHLRITNLDIIDGLSEYQIVRFIGWSDSSPLKSYMHLKHEDVLNAMMKKN